MWNKWIEDLEKIKTVSIPRSIVGDNNTKLAIHGFSDASKVAVCAAVYLVGTCDSIETSSNLLVAKSRIAPKKLSIPRKELVAAHLLTKLMKHVKLMKHCRRYMKSPSVMVGLMVQLSSTG